MSQGNVQIPAPTTTFRDLVTHSPPDGIAPTFLLGPVSSRYLYSMAILYDALTDAAGYAVRARFPMYAPPDTLTWIGQDRLISRGPNEAASAYIARLIQWLDLWRHAGTSTGVMLAVLAYLTPLEPEVDTVSAPGPDTHSCWDIYYAGSVPFPPGQSNPTPPYHLVPPSHPFSAWSWDNTAEPFYSPWMWWRKWLIIRSSGAQAPWSPPTAVWATGGSLAVAVQADATYGSKYVATSPATSGINWGDGVTCWGWGGTSDQAAALTSIVTQWKSAGCWYPWIIVSYDPAWFQPVHSGVDTPDGTWGYCGTTQSDATYGTKWATDRPSCATATMIIGSSDGGGVLGLG